MTFRSPLPDVSIPDCSVYEYVFGDTGAEDGRIALIDGLTGAQTTLGELRSQVDATAAGLAERGFGIGDVAAVFLPNCSAFAVVLHGILRAGGTASTVNVLYTAEELAKQLIDSKAQLIFTVSPLLSRALEAAEIAGVDAAGVITIDPVEGRLSLADIARPDLAPPQVTFDPATHLAVLPYSSGTTGKAKGVMLTHHNLVANIAQAKHLYGVQRGDRVLAVLPFFHIYGLVVLLNVQLKLGAELVILPRFELDTFLGSIANYRVDHVFVAPPVAVVLAKHPDVDKYDVSCLRSVFSGAAPLDEQLGNAVAARLNCRVSQGYGMTELSPVSHLIPPDRPDIPLNSVGIPVPNSENKIIDTETGDEIEIPAEGESAPGELLVRGPNVMAGYLGNEEATAATIEPDGFLHTGDIAVVRADGVVTIVDRLKELIKYKGYQVPPAELEALLLTYPGIGDAAVIGVPDPSSGEIPKAFVVRTDDDLTDEAVMAFVEQKVAPHKRIRQVEFIDAIPKSAAGKILRKDLRPRI